MTEPTSNAPSTPFEGADWLDPLEERVRQSIRGFIEQLVESELEAFLGRQRYGRGGPVAGHRHGHRERQLLGTFGPTTVSLPRARVQGTEGRTREWRSQALPFNYPQVALPVWSPRRGRSDAPGRATGRCCQVADHCCGRDSRQAWQLWSSRRSGSCLEVD